MAKGTGKLIGGILTLVIGGTLYSVSQADVVNKFSEETGMSHDAAEAYIESIPDEDLVSFDELGSVYISEGEEILSEAIDIDCVDYIYEWESDTLSCDEGRSQLMEFAENEIALGKAYRALSFESASTSDIRKVIRLLDENTELYTMKIIIKLIGQSEISELIKTNAYNKALLQAALDS